eukprot:624859-Pelagomonas_calceolata.AAC.6
MMQIMLSPSQKTFLRGQAAMHALMTRKVADDGVNFVLMCYLCPKTSFRGQAACYHCIPWVFIFFAGLHVSL